MSLQTPEQLKRVDFKLRKELGQFIVKTLARPDVSEICVNADSRIWVEVVGQKQYDSGETLPPSMVAAALGTVAAMKGEEINSEHPFLECELPLDGSRIAGTIPPLSPEGPMLSIRKHASAVFPLQQYVDEGRITEASADYLRDALLKRKNILIAGGTSSGKTTLVNALIDELRRIAPEDRLSIMEDTMELQCTAENRTRFVSTVGMKLREIVILSLRFRPDRMIVGEVRGAEALDLITAWNTGHPGGISTIHANDAMAALFRLQLQVLMVSKNPLPEFIAEAIDVIVFMRHAGSVGRQVVEIIEVTGFKEGEYQCRPVYECKRHGILEQKGSDTG